MTSTASRGADLTASPPTRGRLPRTAAWIRQVAAPLTAVGWGAIVVTAAAWSIGWVTGWRELLAVGSVTACAVVVAVAQSWGRSNYEVSLDLASSRVREGDRVYGRVRVRNVSRRPLPRTGLEFPVGAGLAQFRVPRLSAGGEWSGEFRIPTSRRGVLVVGPAATVRADALGLVQRRRRWTGRVEVLVHPRTVAFGTRASGRLRDLDGVATSTIAEASLEFHALREYIPGDDVRRIHWRSSARRGTVMVRQDEDIRRTREAVALITATTSYLTPEEFELAVSVAASWAVDSLRHDIPTQVHARHQLSAPTPLAALDEFAQVEPDLEGDLERATGWMARYAADSSVAAIVTGSAATVQQIRRATAVMPPDTVVVGIVCAPGSAPEVARTERHAWLRLGDLSDLPLMMRRVLG